MAQQVIPSPQDLIDDPSTPYWVSDVIRVALEKDPVDAANCFDVLAKAFGQRCSEILTADLAALNSNQAGRTCVQCGYRINEHGRCGCIPLDDEAP